MLQLEHYFACPYCGAEISMLLEVQQSPQEYVEDCEVCCNPINLSYQLEGEELTSFEARSIEQ